jgi:hypothetical protein
MANAVALGRSLARARLPPAVRARTLILSGRRRHRRRSRRASALVVHRLDAAGEHRPLDRLGDAARRSRRVVAPPTLAP